MADENITHPGGVANATDYDKGARDTAGLCYKAIAKAATADECRQLLQTFIMNLSRK